MKMYPLKFEPIFKPRIWGGRQLRKVFNKNIPENEKIGESWELADLPNDKTTVKNGPLAGKNIRQIIQQYPEQITGNPEFNAQFPLLIKIIDAQDFLSVQVHPDKETCQRIGRGVPKTECWYIIDAQPDAIIYKALKPGTTRDQFAQAIENGTVAELVEAVPVKPGECHHLPAGTAHAIGPGLLIAEIQTPSDTTYRVFDWNRLGQDGKPRQLHIEDALESINFDITADQIPPTTSDTLVDCEYFKVDKYQHAPGSSTNITDGNMKTMVILSGSGRFTESETDFRSGDTILLPATYNSEIKFTEKTEFLIAIPKL